MALRYLFGPGDPGFGDEIRLQMREAELCRTFDFRQGADIFLNADDSWQTLLSRLGPDWQPDFLALLLQNRSIPEWLWDAPVPIIVLAGGWKLHWHRYRHCLQR